MSRQIPKPSQLYRSTMAYVLPKQKRVKGPKAKLRIPTPTKRAPALDTGEESDISDLLTVFLDKDEGDSQKQQQDFYQNHLKNLNRTQLNRMTKKIDRIGQDLIGDDEEEEKFKELQQLVHDTVDPLVQISLEKIQDLQLKVQDRLERFSDIGFTKNKRTFTIHYDGQKMPLLEFSRNFFQEIILEYNQLVSQGIIVPADREQRGSTFVGHLIMHTLSI